VFRVSFSTYQLAEIVSPLCGIAALRAEKPHPLTASGLEIASLGF